MRFMIIRKADKKTEAGVKPSTELMGVMGAYMEAMHKAGILLGGDGLKPSSFGTRIRFSKGKQHVIDGPFTETKELIGGYVIIDVKSQAEALAWVKRWPVEDVDEEAELELELRPYFEAEDLGPEFTPEQRAAEEQIRADLANRK